MSVEKPHAARVNERRNSILSWHDPRFRTGIYFQHYNNHRIFFVDAEFHRAVFEGVKPVNNRNSITILFIKPGCKFPEFSNRHAGVEWWPTDRRTIASNLCPVPGFFRTDECAFGQNIDALKFQAAWQAADFHDLPPVAVRPSDDINGANGAYAAAIKTIFLSKSFFPETQATPKPLPVCSSKKSDITSMPTEYPWQPGRRRRDFLGLGSGRSPDASASGCTPSRERYGDHYAGRSDPANWTEYHCRNGWQRYASTARRVTTQFLAIFAMMASFLVMTPYMEATGMTGFMASMKVQWS